MDKDRNKNPGEKIILCLVGYALVFSIKYFSLRDRPFNLKGGVRIFFFCRAKRKIFIQNITLGYMTKTLNQIIFFFLHQNQNIFFSNIGNQNIFLEKNHNPPPPFKLNGRSLSDVSSTNLLLRKFVGCMFVLCTHDVGKNSHFILYQDIS